MGKFNPENQKIAQILLKNKITKLDVYGFDPQHNFELEISSDNFYIKIDESWINKLKTVNLDAVYEKQKIHGRDKELSQMKKVHAKINSDEVNFQLSINEFFTAILGPIDKPIRTHAYNIWIKTSLYVTSLPKKLQGWFHNQSVITLDAFRKKLLEEETRNLNKADSNKKLIDELGTLNTSIKHVFPIQTYLPPIILQGPPGTGKTYGVERYIKYIIENNPNPQQHSLKDCRFTNIETKIDYKNPPSVIWEIIQAHPSFSYEDFVRGMTTASGSSLHFEAKDRILVKMARLATELFIQYKNKAPKVILLIDEINRCNLSTVLGECILLLEPSKRMRMNGDELMGGTPVRLQYENNDTTQNTLVLPENLEIIGTMNTADRSIALMDYAIRRRFRFIDCKPNEETCPKILSQINVEDAKTSTNILQTYYGTDSERGSKVVELLEKINQEIKETHQLGHSFFMVSPPNCSDEEWQKKMKERMDYEVIPLLKEYHEDFSAWKNNSDYHKLKGYIKSFNFSLPKSDTTDTTLV